MTIHRISMRRDATYTVVPAPTRVIFSSINGRPFQASVPTGLAFLELGSTDDGSGTRRPAIVDIDWTHGRLRRRGCDPEELPDRYYRRSDIKWEPVAPFRPTVRKMRDDEIVYALHSWSQGHHDAPKMRRKTWADYKALHVPVLRDALCRHDTQRLAIDGPVPGHAIGWIAYARWPSIDTVHWIYVANPFRRVRSMGLAPAGAMTSLLEAAGLRKHISYTFLGPHSKRGLRSDEWIADLLRSRGAIVSHVPFQEWSR